MVCDILKARLDHPYDSFWSKSLKLEKKLLGVKLRYKKGIRVRNNGTFNLSRFCINHRTCHSHHIYIYTHTLHVLTTEVCNDFIIRLNLRGCFPHI